MSTSSDGKNQQQQGIARSVWRGVVDAFSPIVRFLQSLGDHVSLAAKALACLPRRPFRAGNYLEAAEYIGFGSLPIILLVGAFTGMVVALQAVFTLRILQAESFAGAFTSKGLALELAPVLTALMLAGRAGSGIATEIGTMRISEQIDALESMAVNPIQFLVLPRIVVGTLVGPILTLLFFVVGMAGAYFIAVIAQGVPAGPFTTNIRDILQPIDVVQGLIKAGFFGFIVTLIGCYQGYNASGGGRGVGIGTTRAVVIASVVVLVSDYFLTDILLQISAVPQ
jgi:phospholipid/cholesterol/gamma-HCH transport system permease protein